MAVNISLEGKYNELKRSGGTSKVAQDAVTRCQYVDLNHAAFHSASAIAEYIDPRGTAVAIEREQTRAVTRLSVLRNFLTLIPLAITWFGFLSISRQKTLDLNTALSTLTPVALLDILFFVILIFVGLLADARANSARKNALGAQVTLDSVVQILCNRVAQQPQVDPSHPEQWAQLVQQQLDEVRRVMQETAQETRKASATTQAVAAQMQSLQQEVNHLASEAQKLSGAVAGIATSSADMAQSAQKVEASSRQLAQATASSAAAQAQTNQHMQVAVASMNAASGAMNTAAAEEAKIPAKLDLIDSSLQRSTRNLADTTRMIKDVEQRLANIVRASGGMHSIWWRLAPWHWGMGGPQVSSTSGPIPTQQQQQQWQQQQQQGQPQQGWQPQQPATPPPGQPLPNTQNMPPHP